MFSSKTTNANLEQTGQAIALFRAALIAGPQNYQAANELGVMLAENGQLELARDLLIRSVAVSPQVTTWKNLAVVHKRAGEGDLAKRRESGLGPAKKSPGSVGRAERAVGRPGDVLVDQLVHRQYSRSQRSQEAEPRACQTVS